MAKVTALKQITTRAQAIRRKHPGKSWRHCVEQASREYRTGHKIGKVKPVKKYRQTGTSNRKNDEQRTARVPGKRKSAAGNTYYERRKNRSDRPGSITGNLSRLKEHYFWKLANALAKAASAKTKRDKNKWRKAAAGWKAKLKKISSV